MALVLADRVRDTTTTTGTGAVTLSGSPPVGFQSFEAVGDGNTTYYTISGGSQWEVGIGTYSSAGPTLTRDTVLASSNSGSAVNFSAGIKDVFVTYPAEKAVTLDGTETLTNKTIDGSNNTITNVSLTTGVIGTLGAANGGTGQSSYATGAMLYASGATTLSPLALGSYQRVLTAGISAPEWTLPANITVGNADKVTITPSSTNTNFYLAFAFGSGSNFVQIDGGGNATYNPSTNTLTVPNFVGSLTGNASTVTNGVYTTDVGTVTDTMLAGGITNAKLVNSSVTIGTTAISLGGTVGGLVGLSGGVGQTGAGTTQTFRVGSGGIAVGGDSYFANSVGVAQNLIVSGSLTLGSPLAVANGGTGLTSPGTSGNVLTSTGTGWTSQAIPPSFQFTDVKTANYTAAASEGVQTDTTGGAFTVTLPATPATGDQVIVTDAGSSWATNNLTVARNGSTIEGSASDLVCDISNVAVQLVYSGTTWTVFAQAGGAGGTIDINTQTSGTLGVARGGTGVTTSTGTGSVVLSAGPTLTGAISTNGSLRQTATAVAVLDVDCSLGNYFTKTIAANSTFTFSNPPSSGTAYAFTLEITHTSGTITWPASVRWPGNTAPTLATGRTHLITFVTDNAGATWFGAPQIDYLV